jgi:hypothetical protein
MTRKRERLAARFRIVVRIKRLWPPGDGVSVIAQSPRDLVYMSGAK